MSRLKSKLELLNALHNSQKKPAEKSASFKFPSKVNKKKSTPAEVPFEAFPDTDFFVRNTGNFSNIEEYFPHNLPFLGDNKESLVIHREGEQFWTGAGEFLKAFKGAKISDEYQPKLKNISFPHDIAFLDIETCGFSAVPLFLIGICYVKEGSIFVTQFFARDYSEELSVLTRFWDFFKSFKLLVSYNGKSFDWPFIEERSYYWRMNPGDTPEHEDLLHYARKFWKKSLPNVKLQTLEKAFCKRFREGDLSGAKIPAAYKNYVENPENPAEMEAAIHHNALDVITLMEIFLKRIEE